MIGTGSPIIQMNYSSQLKKFVAVIECNSESMQWSMQSQNLASTSQQRGNFTTFYSKNILKCREFQLNKDDFQGHLW